VASRSLRRLRTHSSLCGLRGIELECGRRTHRRQGTDNIWADQPEDGLLCASRDIGDPGTDAYFKLTNAKGGVQGHQLELKSLDDNYSPTQALVDASNHQPGQGVRVRWAQRNSANHRRSVGR
jgi:hypothetical protein